jgi:DNA polymerase III psi subunit
MSLNDIKLTPGIIANLYASVLVATPTAKTAEKEINSTSPPQPVKSLGLHKKKVCVLVKEPGAVYLKEEQLNYLTRILSACKLTLEDIALLNVEHVFPIDYKKIQHDFPSTTCLLFGLSPATLELPVDFPAFQLQSVEGCTYLHGPTLDELEPNKADREKLWQSLKKHFNV